MKKIKEPEFKDHIPKDQKEIDDTLKLIEEIKEEEKKPFDLDRYKNLKNMKTGEFINIDKLAKK